MRVFWLRPPRCGWVEKLVIVIKINAILGKLA